MSVPMCSGFLLKKSDGPLGQFQKRWFELNKSTLNYYRNQNVPNKKQLPMGSINLLGTKIDGESGISKLKINVITKDRKYELLAETVSEFEKWVKELTKAKSITNIGSSAGSPGTPVTGRRRNNIVRLEKKQNASKLVTLDDFDVIKTLGRGQFGKVIKIRQKDNGKIFAMKVIDKSIVLSDNIVESTNNEQLILKTINHPFIVRLHYAFQTKDKLCLILDFLSGGELFFHLQREGNFSIEKVRFYIGEIFLAIEHLHSKHIIYRDLKPENIVLDSQGHAIVTDFGLSKTGVENKQTYTFCGTPEYLAPEILKGQGHGKAVDYWSLGILTYTFLCGYPPFSCENIMTLYQLIIGLGEVKFPEYLTENVAYKDAISFTMGLLNRDAEQRLDSMGVRNHAFFKNLDWKALENRQIPPPFVPESSGDYVDEIFSSEEAADDIFNDKLINGDENFKDYNFDIDWS